MATEQRRLAPFFLTPQQRNRGLFLRQGPAQVSSWDQTGWKDTTHHSWWWPGGNRWVPLGSGTGSWFVRSRLGRPARRHGTTPWPFQTLRPCGGLSYSLCPLWPTSQELPITRATCLCIIINYKCAPGGIIIELSFLLKSVPLWAIHDIVPFSSPTRKYAYMHVKAQRAPRVL